MLSCTGLFAPQDAIVCDLIPRYVKGEIEGEVKRMRSGCAQCSEGPALHISNAFHVSVLALLLTRLNASQPNDPNQIEEPLR